MVTSISLDLRKRIVKACDRGDQTKAVALGFEVSADFVRKLKRRRQETGKIDALPRNCGPKPKLKAHEDKLRTLIEERPDATLAELRQRLGVEVQLSTLWYAIDRLGLTVKKNPVRQRAAARRRSSSARRVGSKAENI